MRPAARSAVLHPAPASSTGDLGLLKRVGLDYSIRAATVEDWPQVAELLVELGRDVSASAASNPSFVIRFGGHLALRESRTLVAQETGGRLLGLLDMEFRQRLGHPRPQAWVNDLVVTESVRGLGVGRALLAHAEGLARKRGCFRMSLETGGWREATHRFYEREGWTDNGKWFVKLLDETWTATGYNE
jgi:GNAT superfamily N-acetyltransferase